MSTTEQRPVKDRFRNVSGGTIGVVVRKADGTLKGVPLYPGETVDLDVIEQAETANAPKDPRLNPLANGHLELLREGVEFVETRPRRYDPDLEANSLAAATRAEPAASDPGVPAPAAGGPAVPPVPESMAETATVHAPPPFTEEVGTQVAPSAEAVHGEYAANEEQGVPIEISGLDAARPAPPASLQPPDPAAKPRPRTSST